MKKIKLITNIIFIGIVVLNCSVVSFAGGDPESTSPVIEVAPEEPSSLTPNGNLTLVDDIHSTDAEDKQFITAVSKNGNYFYLVIDRAGKEDNVYLLNMVDEADLMKLMENKPKEPIPLPKPELEIEPILEIEPEKNSTLPLLMFIFTLCGGGTFYYFKFLKNKGDNKGDLVFNEFDEDEDEDEADYDVEEVFNEDDFDMDQENYIDNEDIELY